MSSDQRGLVLRLFEEIKQLGYAGSYSNLARFLAAWTDPDGPLDVVAEAPFASSQSKLSAPDNGVSVSMDQSLSRW